MYETDAVKQLRDLIDSISDLDQYLLDSPLKDIIRKWHNELIVIANTLSNQKAFKPVPRFARHCIECHAQIHDGHYDFCLMCDPTL